MTGNSQRGGGFHSDKPAAHNDRFSGDGEGRDYFFRVGQGSQEEITVEIRPRNIESARDTARGQEQTVEVQ